MKCVINGGNVKVLGKAVHSLSRVGDELYLEPLEDGLSLRTVNSSRSAYACVLFAPLFFQHYEAGAPRALPRRCKVLMKSLLSVFRSLPALEKTVDRCCVSLRPQRSCLVIQLHCKYGMTRTHNLSLQECESLQAVFDPARCPHLLRAPARVLVDAILPFPLTLAEVTLGVSRGRRVVFRSFVEEADPAKAMVTEMSLGPDDFQQLRVQEDSTAITFCLKEFRGLLSFVESSNLPLNIHFDAPGRPAIFTFEDSLLEGHFVLATLSNSQLCSQEPLPPAGRDALPRWVAHSDGLPDDFASDDIDSFMVTMETGGCQGLGTPLPRPPVSPLPLDEDDEDDEDKEPVPGTPPLKKFRSLFFGSVLTGPQPHGSPSRVLAEDSDGDG
ncbi:cell cycle checkpoint control protein RAD9A [Tachyglossus aculeatus]|uniref:cell cycle checkpoint control protein RAD9A n=1 Tax=Tachyglossus aculeatus TaxID=9261 RepID=UPI0018F4C9D2|nr:cell cycle checkpoint control protein RAD9A [Tachyglossus aculeatus]